MSKERQQPDVNPTGAGGYPYTATTPGYGGMAGAPGYAGMTAAPGYAGTPGFAGAGAPGFAGPGYGFGYGQSPYYPQMPATGVQPGYFQGYPNPPVPAGEVPAVPDAPGMLPAEESYIENILRLNRGKIATVYMTFENNERWNAKVFKGIVEAAGRDHIILSDPETNRRYLLLMVYLDYITFDEELNYEYPYGAAAPDQMATYPPR
jgi:spore germination protein Q